MTILVIAIALGLIPAKIAHDKGRNFWAWWMFGALLWIVATPMAILLKPVSAETEIRRPERASGPNTLDMLVDRLRGR